MAGFQIVIRNALTEMMDVVETDTGCKPLKYWWENEQARTFQGTPHWAPSLAWIGIAIFKNVLYVEHINQAAGCQAKNNAVKAQEQSETNPPSQADHSNQAK